jgi:hypothetical protein
MGINILIGGFNPSEKYESVGIIIPNIWTNKRHVPKHQPEYIYILSKYRKNKSMILISYIYIYIIIYHISYLNIIQIYGTMWRIWQNLTIPAWPRGPRARPTTGGTAWDLEVAARYPCWVMIIGYNHIYI